MVLSNPIASGIAAFAAVGLGALGVYGHQQRMALLRNPEVELDKFSTEVQYRLKTTLAYLSSSVVGTGVFAYALRDSPLGYWLVQAPLLNFAITAALLFGTMALDYEEQWVAKNLMFTSLIGMFGASLVPLLNETPAPLIEQALLATGATVGSFGLTAYVAPSQ